MPAKPNRERLEAQVSPALAAAARTRAARLDLTLAGYLRSLVEADCARDRLWLPHTEQTDGTRRD